jgi:endo-1,3-1,4-beta-glycanase ExoK
MKRQLMIALAALAAGAGCAQDDDLATTTVEARPGGGGGVTPQGSFIDLLNSFDTTRWAKADGWNNGSPFLSSWRADHASFVAGQLSLKLTDGGDSNASTWYSGELRTTGYHGYGCFEAMFKPVAAPGVITSLFTYAGPSDNGGNGQWNEIDLEFVGVDTTHLQTNYWTNGVGGHEVEIALGFDAAASFNQYGFKWTSQGISWWVNRQPVHEESYDPLDPTPLAAQSLQKVMMNIWAVDPSDQQAVDWAGEFTGAGTPADARYKWVRYTQGEDCSMTEQPPVDPEPELSDPADLKVLSVAMALAKQGKQATAKVFVVNGLGEPVASATVTGLWSELTTGGDSSRVTNTEGAATFYSASTTGKGTFQFCVTGITKADMTYQPNLNAQTCGTISN